MVIDDYFNDVLTDMKVPENLCEDLIKYYNKAMENIAFSKAYDVTSEVTIGPAPYAK